MAIYLLDLTDVHYDRLTANRCQNQMNENGVHYVILQHCPQPQHRKNVYPGALQPSS